jgi:tRNA (cmo5U34)-methyltransferase
LTQLDKLFRELNPQTGEFSFDEKVARVFDDMISRSIPLYADVQRAVPALARLLDHEQIKVVDLGCSTGTSLIHLARALPERSLELVGVDNSASMLEKCHEKVAALGLESQIATHHRNIQEFEFQDASVVLMNYTLQFLSVAERQELLKRIRESIRPGGFLLVSEKVVHEQMAVNDTMVELYFEYKRRQGYSELEISRKRDALETVLVPLTIKKNSQMLEQAGFTNIEILLKWFNFATFLCYR